MTAPLPQSEYRKGVANGFIGYLSWSSGTTG